MRCRLALSKHQAAGAIDGAVLPGATKKRRLASNGAFVDNAVTALVDYAVCLAALTVGTQEAAGEPGDATFAAGAVASPPPAIAGSPEVGHDGVTVGLPLDAEADPLSYLGSGDECDEGSGSDSPGECASSLTVTLGV